MEDNKDYIEKLLKEKCDQYEERVQKLIKN